MAEAFILRRGGGAVDPYPEFEFNGTSQFIDDGDGNWRIKLLSSGTSFKFKKLGNAKNGIDVFLVGGGGGGGKNTSGNGGILNGSNGGGGGGYTLTESTVPTKDTAYPVTIGAGGAGGTSPTDGGATTAFGFIANGGKGGKYQGYVYYDGGYNIYGGGSGGDGGSGGAGGRQGNTGEKTGGSDGSNGQDGTGSNHGTGQGITTREFRAAGGVLYSTGGNSGGTLTNGVANTGNGGSNGGSGGSGIVVIRNKRS